MARYVYLAERYFIPDRLQPFFKYYHGFESGEPSRRRGDNSPSEKQRDLEEGPRSSFLFLVTCNEAFGYTHEQVLDSSFALITGMLQEHGYILRKRYAISHKSDLDEDDGEWIEVTDFETGKLKRVKKVNYV